MRVTGGVHGGRPIRVPRHDVRPTQDRVREALFSMLAAHVPGCRFLDLYAGSGAVGLEAVSRGAAAVIWVERDAAAYRVLQANVAVFTPDPMVRRDDACRRQDVESFLRGLPPAPFDIVFADPPYAEVALAAKDAGRPWAVRLLDTLRMGGWLATNGIVVLESGVRDAGVPADGWDLIQTRDYGKTALSLYREKEK